MGSLDEVDVVPLVAEQFTEGSAVFGADLAGGCGRASDATERTKCENFLQVRGECGVRC